MQECREDLPGSGAAGSEDEDPARRSHSVFSLFLFCFGFSYSFLPLLVFLCLFYCPCLPLSFFYLVSSSVLGEGGVMDDRPKLCFGSFPLGFGPNPPVFLWFRSLFCPPVEIVFGKKDFGLCFSIGILFLPPSVFWVALCYLPPVYAGFFSPCLALFFSFFLFFLQSPLLAVSLPFMAFIAREDNAVSSNHKV